ncbi:hypothetical protein [Burkholderia sp. S-53]|nr:hypothetical protein [Burkholderia sp. S-53]
MALHGKKRGPMPRVVVQCMQKRATVRQGLFPLITGLRWPRE